MWSMTPQKDDFWAELHREWLKIVYSNKNHTMSARQKIIHKPIKWVNYNGEWFLTYNFRIDKENSILSQVYRADFIMYDGFCTMHDKSEVFQELFHGKRYYQRNVLWSAYIPVPLKPPTLKEYIFAKTILKRHNII